MNLFVVRKTKTGGFVLSNQKPTSVLGKMFFPGDKYQLASLTNDYRGEGNVITDTDAIDYLNSLKRGDVINWCEPTDQPVTLQDGTELRRKWVMPVESGLIDAVDAFVGAQDDVVEEPAKPAKKAKA